MFALHQVDAFTTTPFSGNPAAVCLLDRDVEDAFMQAVAAEMNLSETAFVLPMGKAHRLRWFTPIAEVDLCGHATLATAHVLFSQSKESELRFETRSGELGASRRKDRITLDFPRVETSPVEVPLGLFQALGVRGRCYRAGADVLVELNSPDAVRAAAPDFRRLGQVDARGVIVTASGEAGADFVSRFFAPRVGVDEDPVTGSAHCALAPFWAKRLGRAELLGRQLSSRGGEVHVETTPRRVRLSGAAITVFEGRLRIDP
ncbi:MAG: PhzF family phenazine biosynthesis protein [Sandaracinaceae bacterium]